MTLIITSYIMFTLSFISLLLIENGAFITEQSIAGYNNGAFYIFYIFIITNLLIFYHYIKKINLNIIYSNNKLFFYTYSLIYISLLLYDTFILNPDANRFNTFQNFPGPLRRLAIYTMVAYPFIYFYCMFKEKYFLVKISYLCLFITLAFIRGEHFGGLYSGISVFFIAVVLQHRLGNIYNVKKHKKTIIWSFMIFVIGFIFIVNYKFSQLGYAVNFFNRIVLQQHVLWGTINVVDQGGIQPFPMEYFNNFFSFESFRVVSNYGLGKLMVEIGGQHAIDFIEIGGRFTSGYPAIIIYHFGYILAFFISIIISIFAVFLIKIQFHLLNKYNVIIYAIGMKLISTYKEFTSMGEYGGLNIKFILAIIFFIIALFTINNRKIIFLNYRKNNSRQLSVNKH
jgi:hypothetical protein